MNPTATALMLAGVIVVEVLRIKYLRQIRQVHTRRAAIRVIQ